MSGHTAGTAAEPWPRRRRRLAAQRRSHARCRPPTAGAGSSRTRFPLDAVRNVGHLEVLSKLSQQANLARPYRLARAVQHRAAAGAAAGLGRRAAHALLLLLPRWRPAVNDMGQWQV